jgi:hypothetical protein
MHKLVLSAVAGLVGLLVCVPDTFGAARPGGGGGRGSGGFRGAAQQRRANSPRAARHNAGPGYTSSGSYAAPAAPEAAAADEEVAEQELPRFTSRYLRVKNDTKEKITLYVQYRTLTNKNRFRWYPAAPSMSDEALVFELEPGSETDLYHDDWRINASRVRLWATGGTSEWMENKENDLWLVQKDDQGSRSYAAEEAETYTFTIAP